MKNTILYIGNFSFPHGSAPGSRVLGNGYLLKELGFDVFFIGTDVNLTSGQPLEYTKQFYDDFRYYNLPYPSGIKDWLSYKKRFNEVISLIEDEDLFAIIIYGSPTISLFGNLIRKWCNKNNIKFITDCVDWLSAGHGGFFIRFAKFIDTSYQKRFLNSKADGVIAVSSYLSNYYKNKGCKTVVIPPLVNIEYFKGLYKNNRISEVVNLIYVGLPFPVDGRIVKESSYKDRLDKVIDALYELRDLEFVFNIYGLSKKQYLSVTQKHGRIINTLGEKIKFHGYVNNTDAIINISLADFTVLFRDVNRATTAGFPTKVVETISCGTPVITTNTSDLKKYIEVGKNGFIVNIDDKDKLLASMRKILLLDRNSISFMKKHCKESGLFSFHNFTIPFNHFLNSM